jgi:hypothetical protein
MAERVVKTHPKSGTVSRAKIRAAARRVAKSRKTKSKPGVVTRGHTASGRREIGFRTFGIKPAA